ncbi:MAG: NUDIX domain-containing protein [Candidatus Harrisonbacteria bacterium]|nr:NUDIX domain-containing protein [Candidatus Harrisonbacteria bacterium]
MAEKNTGAHKSPAKKVISAGVIIFRKTREGKKYLLLYHGRGYWNFPKGKLEQEERSKEAALREVEEETGIKKSELKVIGNFKTFEKFYYRSGKDNIFKVVILYLAETTQSRVIVSDEHEGYGWFRFSQAKRILSKFTDSVKILERANNYLNRQGAGQTQPSQRSDPGPAQQNSFHVKRKIS